MTAYLIARVTVNDPDIYSQYTAISPAIIKAYGGRFLTRGGTVETLEGEIFQERLVIVEFDTMELARNFYASAEYQKARQIRSPVSKAQFMIVEGI